jgi:hypothetical protein
MVTLAVGADADSQKLRPTWAHPLKQTDSMKLSDKSDSLSTFAQIARVREPDSGADQSEHPLAAVMVASYRPNS